MKLQNGAPQYRVSWYGYDQTWNTWEGPDNIVDKQLIKDFNSQEQVKVGLHQTMMELREQVAQYLMTCKGTKHLYKLEFPQACYVSVAHALLARLASPQSREGKRALQIEFDKGPQVQTSAVQVNEMQDIGDILDLVLVRPENSDGAVIYKRGKGSNHSIVLAGPPFVAQYANQLPCPPHPASATIPWLLQVH